MTWTVVNPKKTKVMTVGKEHEDIVVTCGGKHIEQVSHFKNLSKIITEGRFQKR